jgi:hypothetical protein
LQPGDYLSIKSDPYGQLIISKVEQPGDTGRIVPKAGEQLAG